MTKPPRPTSVASLWLCEGAAGGREAVTLRVVLVLVSAFVVSLLAGCQRDAPAVGQVPGEQAPLITEPARTVRPPPDPTGEFRCQDLRPTPDSEQALLAETIELTPPSAGKKILMSKTEVIVTFSRDEYLKTAHCLALDQAVSYIEKETGWAEETPMRDAFQLSYVAAALMDSGRVGVRRREETESRKSIVRDGWAASGCAGHCRSFGRLYRLSEKDSSFILRITDQTKNDWE